MSEKGQERANFIQLYRRKLQNDLEDMGYPGGKETSDDSKVVQTSESLIIDAGSQLSSRTGESTLKKRRKAVQK